MVVRQLRLVVTVDDYDEAVRFYRDILGLPEQDAVQPPAGRVMILDAGRATLELAEPITAEYIDEVEAGRRVGDSHGQLGEHRRDAVVVDAALAGPPNRDRHEGADRASGDALSPRLEQIAKPARDDRQHDVVHGPAE